MELEELHFNRPLPYKTGLSYLRKGEMYPNLIEMIADFDRRLIRLRLKDLGTLHVPFENVLSMRFLKVARG